MGVRIKSFVYAARRPFSPQRLWDLVSGPFCVIQHQAESDGDEDDDEGGQDGQEDDEEDGEAPNKEVETGDQAAGEDDNDESDEETMQDPEEAWEEMLEEKAALDLPSHAKTKAASPLWKGVLRSKGFIWLATRPHVYGEWSQAGVSHLEDNHLS